MGKMHKYTFALMIKYKYMIYGIFISEYLGRKQYEKLRQ